MKNRSQLDICTDILKHVQENNARGLGRTQIVYRAYLSSLAAKSYIDLLLSSGLLTLKGDKYHVTGKGQSFLLKAQELQQVLRGRGPQPAAVAESYRRMHAVATN